MKLWPILIILVLLCSSCGGLFAKPIIPTENLPELAKPLNWISWLPLGMVVGIVFGFFGFLNGQKQGLPAMLSCGLGLVLSLTVIRFAFWIALFGGIGVLGAAVTFGWSFLNKNKGLVLITAKKLNGKK